MKINVKELQDDLIPLYSLLVEQKIPCEIKEHPNFQTKMKEILGFLTAGRYQIFINRDGTTYSVIRGYASDGDYEIYNLGNGEKFREPKRFKTAEELIRELIKPCKMQLILPVSKIRELNDRFQKILKEYNELKKKNEILENKEQK